MDNDIINSKEIKNIINNIVSYIKSIIKWKRYMMGLTGISSGSTYHINDDISSYNELKILILHNDISRNHLINEVTIPCDALYDTYNIYYNDNNDHIHINNTEKYITIYDDNNYMFDFYVR
jgi:hypothetical protein